MPGKESMPSEKPPKRNCLQLGADAGKRRHSGAARRCQAEEEESVLSSISAKILRKALKQQQEEGLADSLHATTPAVPALPTSFPIPAADDNDDDGLDALSEYDGGVPEIDEEDEKALAAFKSSTTMGTPIVPLTFFFLAMSSVAMASCPSYQCGGTVDVRYPFWIDGSSVNDTRCGYPSLGLECQRGTPVLRLPSGNYGITRILYSDRAISLYDLAVANLSCPFVAGRNVTLPPGAPPPLSLTERDENLTFYMNCSFKGIQSQRVDCLEGGDGWHHSYVFRESDYAMPDDYATELCQEIVGMPVLRRQTLNSTSAVTAILPALRMGFELRWQQAVEGQCGACEKAGGMCGNRREAANRTWSFACFTRSSAAPSVAPSATPFVAPSAGPSAAPKSSSSGSSKRLPYYAIVVIVIAVLLCSVFVCYLYVILRKRGQVRIPSIPMEMQSVLNQWKIEESESEFSLYDFEQIMEATRNFSDDCKLGEGGYGAVYKGELSGGLQIAVKRLSSSSVQGLMEFKAEIQLIAKLQHTNLVRLLGCCIQAEEKILVYEYMHNKSLDDFIFDSAKAAVLNWERRFHIIDGIAQGILYLHKHSRLRVIHRDLKASNILLDIEMKPKISDFGYAQIFSSNMTESNTTSVVGTLGYIAPEYLSSGNYSTKSDIYSFGILLLEILSGKMTTSVPNFTGYAYKIWQEARGHELVDVALGLDYPPSEVMRCLHVALLCIQESADDRPDISEVVNVLGSERIRLPHPKKPAYYNGRMSTIQESPGSVSGSSYISSIVLSQGRRSI